MMNILAGALAAALMTLGGTVANAVTITLEASITGSAALLSELGITDGTAKARATFNNDVSSGAILVDNGYYKFDHLYSTYSAFSLIAPGKTINAVASDAGNHRVYTRDGLEDRSRNINEQFQVASLPYSSDPNSYYVLRIDAWDYDQSKWDRATPITADLLNSYSTDFFRFEKFVGTSFNRIQSYNITWAEVSVVPLPGALPLLVGALDALGLIRRRKSRPHPL
jgi:hypothetical protein